MHRHRDDRCRRPDVNMGAVVVIDLNLRDAVMKRICARRGDCSAEG